MTSGSVVADLQRKKEALQHQINEIEQQIQNLSSKLDNGHSSTSTTLDTSSIIHIEKSGYLNKWQDRSIGWAGTKWDLRFVRLSRGRLSYYKTHNDNSPRYILTLRNCAVRDDGYKKNSRYWAKKKDDTKVDIQTPGAYYHVFSIYQRSENQKDREEYDDDIVPLLRFSSQSFAEKSIWINQLSDACAFCDTDEFTKLEEQYAITEQCSNSIATSYKSGTLPPMFFAPAPPPKLKRHPSNATFNKKGNNRASYLKKNKLKDAPKSNTQRTSGYPPSKPMHRNASPSYLSDEAPMQNYRGILNLALIILVISNFRILLATMKDHGFVVMDWIKIPENASSTFWNAEKMVDFPLLCGYGLLFIFISCGYLIEKSISKKIFPEWVGILMHIVNTNAALIIPTAIVWYKMDSIIGGISLVMAAAILFMKLVSYAHANADYRNHPERCNINTIDFIQDVDDSSLSVKYPDNITLGDIYYFWFAPTLTYQIAFPRLMKRNWLRILTLIFRLFLSNVLIVFLFAQTVSPNLRNLTRDLENGKKVFSVDIFTGYLLKLTIANTYIWLLVFYSYFHLFFNLLAELLKFGDRVFYKDWWNSSNVSAYWRLWNLPVHYWLVRHLYFPCLRRGMNKNLAMIIVFFYSAVMHEYVISIPFHIIRPWAFLGMMAQIPLVAITKYFDKLKPGSSIGNIIFWLSFCIVGQPMAMLMYTVDLFHMKEPSAPVAESIQSSCKGFFCREL